MKIIPHNSVYPIEQLFDNTIALDGQRERLEELVPNLIGKTQGHLAYLTSAEVNACDVAAEKAIALLYKATERFIENEETSAYHRLGITSNLLIELIKESWQLDSYSGMIHRFMPNVVHGLYANFDATIDSDGKVWFYEFNGNTPVLCYESIVVQDTVFNHVGDGEQSNSLFEAWCDLFTEMNREFGELKMVFGGFSSLVNDLLTIDTMCNAAIQCGHNATIVDMRYDIEFDHLDNMMYVTGDTRPIDYMFNLFPWEDYDEDSLITFKKNYRNLRENGKGTVVVEPPYKVLMSNKAFLAYVWEHFPEEAHEAGIIPTYLQADKVEGTCVEKPIYGRMSANIRILDEGEVVDETSGDFGDNLMVYQPFTPLIETPEGHFQLRVWLAPNTEYDYEYLPCGIAVRRSNSRYNMNVETEEFIPHIIVE